MKFNLVSDEKFKENGKLMLEMSQIGRFNDCTVYVRSNDAGKIPHFHIVDSNTLGNLFHTCIRIDKPEYFHHTGKEDVLNSKDRKDLIQFLKFEPKSKRYRGWTNWELLVDQWNINNSDVEIDEDQVMPDYTLLR